MITKPTLQHDEFVVFQNKTMNPQYMQQQPPYYGGANNGPPRGGLNANLPPVSQFNGSENPQGFAPKNPAQGPPPPINEAGPPPPQQSSYYGNNMRGDYRMMGLRVTIVIDCYDFSGPPTSMQPGPPPPMSQPPLNQNNLVNQMSNINLGSQQRPPSAVSILYRLLS